MATFGYRYARNEYIARGIPRKYRPKSLKRTQWNNTMTYVDLDGHTWYRLCDQDIIRFDRSGKFAQIFWEDGWISSLTPRRIAEVLRSVWSIRKYAISMWDLNHREVQVTIDTGMMDYRKSSSKFYRYRDTISLTYKGHQGMIIPRTGLPNIQGFENAWKFQENIFNWARGVFKHGIRRTAKRVTFPRSPEKWIKQPTCPECAKELEMFNKAWNISSLTIDGQDAVQTMVFKDGAECSKAWEDLAYWKSIPYGIVPDGELPFNHYQGRSEGTPEHTHHLFKHIEAEEYPPELLAAAVRSHNNPNMIEYSNDPLFGRKFRIKSNNTGYLRWILRGYLQARVGLPVYKV